MAETLMETAEREAREAEAESPPAPKKGGRPRKEGAKPNGKANGVALGEEPAAADGGEEAPSPTSGPGEQGSATQGDEVADLPIFSRQPTVDQVRIAKEITLDLQRNAHQLAMDDVVDKLLQVVDVDPALTMPPSWQHDEKQRYARSDTLEKIGTLLLKGCRGKLELSPSDVVYFWRNSKSWEKQGVTVIAEAKVVPAWARTLTDGVKVIVHVNYRKFREMNTLQKVRSLYHALRSLDDEARRVPPHFHGWTDELEFFGPLTFEEEVRMVNAIDRGKRKRFEYQLSILDEAPGEDGEE